MYIEKLNNKFIRFIFVGILNTIFGYSLFALFIYFNIHYSLAVFLSTLLGVLFNFKTIGNLVFKSNDNSLIFRFILVYVILYLCNISLISLSNKILNDYYLSGLIATICCAVISFMLNKKYVFKE